MVQNGAYHVKVVDAVQDLEVVKSKHTVPNISCLYNFQFETDGLRVWQAYKIGEGTVKSHRTNFLSLLNLDSQSPSSQVSR